MEDHQLHEAQNATPRREKTPGKRKKRTMGLVAFCLVIAAILFLGCVAGYSYMSYRNGALDGAVVSLISVAVILSAALAGLSLLTAILTLFLRRQRKGFAVGSLLMSLLVLLGCVGAMYIYHYTFGKLDHDSEFNDLSDQELNVVEVNNSGEVLRETGTADPFLSDEEIIARSNTKEIEFEDLTKSELPTDVLQKITGEEPAGPSYLMGDYDKVTNFLLFGLDASGTADSQILLSVDSVHHKIKLISIARDSYLFIPDFKTYAKVAYTYNWGGAKLAVSTINRNFALNVQDYIAVDWDQLTAIIDSLGGIDLYLTEENVEFLRVYGYTGDNIKVGLSHLDGAEATLFSRNRGDSEAKRTGRQRDVLNAIMTKLRKMPLSKYPDFIRNCLGLCTTSFGTDELMEIAVEVVQKDYGVESYALVENVPVWSGLLGKEQYFYCVYDIRRASDWIYRTIYEEMYLSGYRDDPIPEAE